MWFPYCLSAIVIVLKIQVTFSVLSFEASSNYVEKGSQFKLTCHVTPLTGIVQFLRNGSAAGSCSAPFGGVIPGTCLPADIVQDLGSKNTTWTISSASFITYNGTWTCVHNTETGQTFVMVTELAKVITINDTSLPIEPDINTDYKAFVDCSYPMPEIKWTLRECGTNNIIDVLKNPSVIEDPSTCTYPAQQYSSTIKVSSMASPGRDPKCYWPLATLYYSFASSPPVSKQSNISFSFPGSEDCSDLYKLLALLCLLDVIAFIVLLYRKIKMIEQLDYVEIVNIAKNCCGKWIFSQLPFECVVMLVITCIQAVIIAPIIIVKCNCPVDQVIGSAFLLIAGCTVIYMVIFWIVIWCVCRRKIAVNRVDSEIIKESPRKSINGDAGLRSPVTPGRKLPPLPPLTRTDQTPWIKTDPDKLVNTEKKKKKKKKTKTGINEEDQAETNKSEINDQVDAENLPETNKTSV